MNIPTFSTNRYLVAPILLFLFILTVHALGSRIFENRTLPTLDQRAWAYASTLANFQHARYLTNNSEFQTLHPVIASASNAAASVNPLISGSPTTLFLCDGTGNNCLPGRSYLNKKIHTGLDLDTSTDEQTLMNRVRATLPGIVATTPVTTVTCSASTDTTCSGLGNRIVLRHLLDDGLQINSLYGHLQHMESDIQAGGLTLNSRVSGNQFLGYKGETGFAFGSHLHFEISRKTTAAAVAECAEHWQPKCEKGKRVQVANGSHTVEDPAPYRNAQRRALLPWMSFISQSPGPSEYEVYGVVNNPLFAAISITPSIQSTISDLGVGGRPYTGDLNQDIFNVPSASFMANESKSFFGSRSDLSAGDYRFFAYVNKSSQGFPLKFAILPNANSTIVDNDSQSGYVDISTGAEDVAGYYLSAKLMRGGNATNQAEWHPSLTPGNYEIWIHVPTGATAKNVSYKVSLDGTTLVETNPFNQSAHNDAWVQLTVGGNQIWNLSSSSYVKLDNTVVTTVPVSELIGVDAVKFVFVSPSASNGTVKSTATLDGEPWPAGSELGSVDYDIIGPGGVIIGTAVPAETSMLPVGQYTFIYKNGGPANSLEPTISPSSVQTLSAGESITFNMNFVSATPSPSPSPSPSPGNNIELLSYQASEYRYQVIETGSTPPAGFEQPNFDDTSWTVGTAAFGFSVGFCPLHSTDHTTWPVSTDLLVRRNVNIPAGTCNVRVMISVDNDIVDLFFNGTAIATNIQHADCPLLDDFQFDVPQDLIRVGQNTVVYHLRDRGFESFFDTRILGNQSSIDSSWGQKVPTTIPLARQGPAMVYDMHRQEVVLFGGVIDSPSGGAFTNDTWVWNGSNWTQRFPATNPSPRKFHSMVYDPIRQQVVLFGGVGNGIHLNDTWTWDGNNWSQQLPATNPPARDAQAMVYDAARQNILMFGGNTSGNLNDTWIWDGSNWIQKSPSTSPMARAFAGIAYDAVQAQAILFGGTGSNVVFGDTWIWNGSTWVQASPNQSPSPRYSPSMSYDATHGETVLFGGATADNAVNNETWVWNGVNWTQRFPITNPGGRVFAGITYDAARMQILLFGGDANAFTHIFLNDTWIWPVQAKLFFDGATDARFLNSTFSEPVVDSRGRLLLVSTHFSTVCGFNVCGIRLNSVSPSGVLNWQSPDGVGFFSSAVSPFTRNHVIGPDDRIYVPAFSAVLHAFQSDGSSVPGWPINLNNGAATFGGPVIVDSTDNTIYASGGMTMAALNADGTDKWRLDYGPNYAMGPARNLYAVKFPDIVGLDRATGNQFCSTSLTTYNIVGGLQGTFTSFHSTVTSLDVNCNLEVIYTSPGPEIVLYRFGDGKIFAYDYPAGSLDSTQIRLLALSPKGTLLWRNSVILPSALTDPIRAIRNGVLYVLGQDTVDSNRQKLFLVDASTGEIMSSVATAPYCESCGVAVAAEGTIYLNDLGSTKIYKLN